MFKPKKLKPIVKQLEEKYGGKWEYIRYIPWWECEELNLHAHYVAIGGYDVNGKYMNPFIDTIYVYGLDKGPETFISDQAYERTLKKLKKNK